MTTAVYAFEADQSAASRLASALGAPLRQIGLHKLPDGESLPSVSAPAPRTVLLYRALD